MTKAQLVANHPAFPCGDSDTFGMTYREWLVGIIAAGMAGTFREAGSGFIAAAAVDMADAVIAQLAEEGKS